METKRAKAISRDRRTATTLRVRIRRDASARILFSSVPAAGRPKGHRGKKGGSPDSALAKAAAEKYGSGENFLKHIREVSMTRGTGWVIVYYDLLVKRSILFL